MNTIPGQALVIIIFQGQSAVIITLQGQSPVIPGQSPVTITEPVGLEYRQTKTRGQCLPLQ